MSDTDLCYTPATELAGLIRDKTLSPVELMDAVLARIDALEPEINAFATLTADAAMDAARKAEADVADGVALGPLHGIPVTIKDLVVTEGIATERGSYSHKGVVPDVDAPCVTRLKQAGAIVLGKTTTSEFGWKGVSHSPLTGITSNPWKKGYNAGASSAGAGAGAAAGYGPLHQGSDGAGSIRMPSHFSGIFGIKPTYGRVPNWPVPNNDQSSHIGPMTRTVADSALMLEVMSGPHPWDHTSLEAAPEAYPLRLGNGVANLKVAYSPDLGHARVDDEIAELVSAAVDVFASDLGCRVEEVVPSFGPDGPELIRFLWSAHEQSFAPLLDEFRDRMDPGLLACMEFGRGHSLEDYLDMRQRKITYVEQVHRAFEQCDLMLTPAVSVAAFPADRLQPEHWPQHPWDWVSWAEFSYPFNFSGNPAASVPCGFTKDGLPVGLQIVGPRFADLTVLQAAAAFEKARPWADKRPPV
ncbi:MAG: amidase family protein [Alphaproteobacteria bacterium]|nr:amidase family protein [Alphaproteobacteria bacterium]